MSKNYAIEVKNVSMLFHLNKERVDNAKEYFVRLLTRKLTYTEFWALRDVSFKIEKGDRVGVLGFNGAGKSTLLKTIAGVLKPTMGEVKVSGVIAPMLELGAGFDMNYSGAENIYLYGATMGYSRKYIAEKYDEIVEFSELGMFIDTPIRNYSSGMLARLAFSVATIVVPEILIVDEILSVGDENFQNKSRAKMMELMGGGTTVLFVSHNLDQIRDMCSRVVWIDGGDQKMVGNAKIVCDEYKKG